MEKEVSEEMAKEIDNWMELHVSSEEYSQSLRDAVNGYYQHEINSGITQEEAMHHTAPVAENALNAIDEFNANVQESSIENGAEGLGSNENGGLGDEDGGLGGNEDGGGLGDN